MRRSGRAVALLVGLGVLAGGAVVADVVARAEAERRIAADLRSSGFDDPVDVDVAGTPFLTQAARRRLDHVEVTAASARLGPRRELMVRDVTAVLDGVTRRRDAYSAERVRYRVTLPYQTLQAQLPRQGVDVGRAPGDRLTVRMTASVFGQEVAVSGTADVEVAGPSALQVRGRSIEVLGVEIDDAILAGRLREALTFRVAVPGLPPGTGLESVAVRRDGLEVVLRGQDVALSGAGG